jgi:Tol biopolymer transport system component
MKHIPRASRTCTLAVIAGMLAAVPADLSAQYFGRNKVQYENFDWRILNTPHFDLHFYPEEEEPARDAGRMLERWYQRQSSLLRNEFDKKPVILYASHPDFQQTNVIGGSISEGTGGVTESGRTRIVLPLTGIYADNDHVLGHELVHAFQYDIAGKTEGGLPSIGQLPLWVIEGMAEYLSLGREDAHTAMWLRDAAYRDDLPTITQLTRDPRYFPYRYGQAMWAYIGGRWGDRIIPTLYRQALRTGFEGAFRTVLGYSSDSLSREWHAAIRAAYLPGVEGRTPPNLAGDRVIAQQKEGAMNLSPVLSPDGRFVAFFSRRGLFSVDLYLADARTGRILRELASPVNSPHFDAISFISSSGAWSPDSKKFAFIVFSEGDNEIDILDVDSRRVERRIHHRDVDAVSHIAWSPDGQNLAFSGMRGGISDLYLMNLASGTLRKLTDDKYADLHPTWSPDGRSIAFSTDRGTGTNLETLSFSPLKLAIMDVSTSAIREIPVFRGAKHINPQFSPDGRELYFISDPDGYSDIYRLELETGAAFRVTRLVTGVSGITYLSPALTVAPQTGRLMFSVFERAGNNIYALDADRARGVPADPQMVVSRLSTLPPLDPVDVFVTAYLRDPTTGLPGGGFPVTPYRSRLALDYVGQPTIGVAASSYGTALGGSVAAYFGEMLGNRTVGLGLQGYGELADFGGQAFYLNTEHRWNWAVSGGHFPYLTGYTQARRSTREIDGTTYSTVIYDELRQRVFQDNVTGTAQYPFSTTRRAEFSLGGTMIYYTRDIHSIEVIGNQVVDETRSDADAPPGITFGQATAALVGDNSFMAFTSPIQGGRYRFEVSPAIGGISFYTLLGDTRRYLFMRPVTFAMRGMSYGRYGGGSEDTRLSPIYLGQPAFIRGYDPNNFSVEECVVASTDADPCPEFNRLVGSRIALANFELRVPLFGNEEFGLFNLPFLPTEIAPFFDVGVAWRRGESPELRFERGGAARVPVMSTGVSARVNVLGYLVGEVFYVYPFQREIKGAHFGFQLQPGW